MRPSLFDERITPARRPRHRAGLWFFALLLVFLGLSTAAVTSRVERSSEDSAASPSGLPPPAWADIVKPIEIFDVTAPQFDRQPRSYLARRNVAGGGRQDFLSFGTLDGAAPYLRLSIYQVGTETVPTAPLFVDVARRAADAGLGIRHSGTPYLVPTRFGQFEVLDLDMADAAVPACKGFRIQTSSPDLRFVGLFCPPKDKPVTAAALGCVLERIDLNASGGDGSLPRFFAKSELARNPFCAGAGMAPTPLRAQTTDDPGLPGGARRPIGKASGGTTPVNQKRASPL